jgi:hypothetical protein
MKTINLLFFIFYTMGLSSQTTDILYVPNDNSLLATYHNSSNFGLYLGGHYVTSRPYPYIYTTPFSFINRLGVTISDNNHSISLMGGLFYGVKNYTSIYRPDVWLKINPIRLLFGCKTMADFSVGINYMDGINYGVGVSFTYNIY